MLIPAVCPRCRATYQVQDSLRGKAMRCVQPLCRQIFVVDGAPEAPPPSPPPQGQQQSGSVGDLIPLVPIEQEKPSGTHVSDLLEVLPAESADPSDLPIEVIRPDEGSSPPDWSVPPPVRRPPRAEEEPSPPPAPRPSPRKPEEPRVLEQGDWSAPPVRRGKEKEPDAPRPDREPRENRRPSREAARPDRDDSTDPRRSRQDSTSNPDLDLPVHPPSRWVKWIIVPLVLFTVGALSFGGFMIWKATRETEEKLSREAAEFFTNGQFPAAENLYDKLLARFPDSEQSGLYRFRQELCVLRGRMAEPPEDVREVLDHAAQFLKERAKDPLLPDHAAGFSDGLIKLLSSYTERELSDLKGDESLAMLEHARPVIEAARRLKLPKDTAPPAWNKLDEAFDGLRKAVARFKAKNAILERLRALAGGKPSYSTLTAVQSYLNEIRPGFADVADSAEAKQLVEQVRRAHLEGVRYVEHPPGPTPRASAIALEDSALLIDPPLRVAPRTSDPEEIPALALSRGLLYALDRTTGQARWALRVGIDTTALPLHLPRRAGSEDMFLVLSSDTNTLSAVRMDGTTIWRYRLPAPVLGRPVVVDRRAYLATYSGEIHEIELIKGQRLGSYDLGQRLTLGGTLEPGSSRVYFPADDGCVYVLDVVKRRCEMILYSGHPAGSLRGEPILIPAIRDETPGYLVLNQAADLDSIRLRVFDLPLRDSQTPERSIDPPPTMRGWSWFAPYHDPEKLLLLSDAGRLGLFGIRQPNNRDQALFPLLPGGGQDLAALLKAGTPRRGRSEVIHVEGDEVWVLASDRMQRLRMAWGPSQGPRLVPVWPQAVEVGSPVHASQVLERADGRKSLIAVTQPPGRSCTVAHCLNEETGEMLWQRQLGLVARSEPIALSLGEGDPVWLALDQAGSLFLLDPTRYTARPGVPWLSDSRSVLLADALEENLDHPPRLLLAADGKSAFAVAMPGDGREMVVRQILPEAPGTRRLQVKESRIRLSEPPAGRPTLVGNQLFLPLEDGALGRIPLPIQGADGALEGGPNWRAERAGTEAVGLIVPLDNDRFITSDGARGLMVWEWPAQSNAWKGLPTGRGDEPTLQLPERITGMAVVPGKSPLLVVSDSRGELLVVAVLPNGALEIRRTWKTGGEITSGPFVLATESGPRVACIVDRTRLVWYRTQSDREEGSYTTPGEDPLVGKPLVVGEQLIVSDQSGLYIALDLRTGKPTGPGYQLRGSIAPITAPVPFQKDRLLAPLSDGTLLLLAPERLR